MQVNILVELVEDDESSGQGTLQSVSDAYGPAHEADIQHAITAPQCY